MLPERNGRPVRRIALQRTGEARMAPTRQAFVVGRSNRKSTTYVVLTLSAGPIHGPWTLKAVVSSN